MAALDDLVGEIEPVNVPGVTADRFASCTRKLHPTLYSWLRDEAVARALPAPEGAHDRA